ncbi:unnamed protein product [Discosporangium mesarthrocarpum]
MSRGAEKGAYGTLNTHLYSPGRDQQANPGAKGTGSDVFNEDLPGEAQMLNCATTSGDDADSDLQQGDPPTADRLPNNKEVNDQRSSRACSDSPEIHFDERLGDDTSSIAHPILYFATEEFSLYNPTDHHVARFSTALHELIEEPSTEGGDDKEGEPDRAKTKIGFSWTFREKSPQFTRFGVLILISLLPFGAHFVKNSLSSLEVYFLEARDKGRRRSSSFVVQLC